jgi:hypothetical protein
MATAKKTTSESTIVVSIPRIRFQTAAVKIIGTSPLVTNPMSKKAMKAIEDKQQGVPKTKKHDIRNPWQDFFESLYWITEPPEECSEESWDSVKETARFGFHVGGIKDCAVMAAVRRGLVKNGPVGRGLFNILGAVEDRLYGKQVIEIRSSSPPKLRVDCLKPPMQNADMRYRPQFNDWSMEFVVKYEEGTINLEQILNWYQLAGFSVGLGESRAEKSGDSWGSFELG